LRYALLIYNDAEIDNRPEPERHRVTERVYEVLARPSVTGWLRLRDVESATTVRHRQSGALLTDGPYVDSKDYLGGLILLEAENLDAALGVAGELQEIRGAGAIEVRPVHAGELRGA